MMKAFGKSYSLIYDYLYQDKDYKKECDFIEAVFKKYALKPRSILELGCGTGAHAFILSKRQYKVTGVDRSANMLAIAKRKIKEDNLSVRFIQKDISKLKLQEKFDAVIAMFAVVGYQTDNKSLAAIFRVARDHLRKDGIFLFDCWHGNAVLHEKPTVRIKEITLAKDEKIIRFTEPILNILDHTVETRFKVLRIKKGSLVGETNESHLMRFFFPQEIKYFLEIAGFKKIEFCPFPKLEKSLTEHDWNMTVITKI